MAAHHAAIKAHSGGMSTEKAKQRVSAALLRASAAPHPGVPPVRATSTTVTDPEQTMDLAHSLSGAPLIENMQPDSATPGVKAGGQPCCVDRGTTSSVVAGLPPASESTEAQKVSVHGERSQAVRLDASCTTTQTVCRKDGRKETVYAWAAKLAAGKAEAGEKNAQAKAQIAAEKLAKTMATETGKQKKWEEAVQKKKEQEEAAAFKAEQKAEQAAQRFRYVWVPCRTWHSNLKPSYPKSVYNQKVVGTHLGGLSTGMSWFRDREARGEQKRAASLGFGTAGALDKGRGFMEQFVKRAIPVHPVPTEPQATPEEREAEVCSVYLCRWPGNARGMATTLSMLAA
jgi:hypothetical protein